MQCCRLLQEQHFWQLTLTFLKKIAEYQGAALGSAQILLAVLMVMVSIILDMEGEEEVLKIIGKGLGVWMLLNTQAMVTS